MRIAAVARILTGVMFIAFGWGKVTGDFVRTGFAEQTTRIAGETWPFWKSFLEAVVRPNASAFGWLIGLAELAIGIGLVLGLFTRAAAAAGALLMFVILLGTGRGEPGATWDQWVTAGMMAKITLLVFLLLFAADPGRVWGLDGILRRRRRAGAAAT